MPLALWLITLVLADLLTVCWEKYPLSPHLSVGHGLPGHFRDHAQCRSCGLSSASVTSVGVVLWHRSLRLCCANPTARAISDMAVGPNPESNPGLSDRRRQANDIRDRTRSCRGFEPGLREAGSRNFFRRTRAGIEPGSSQSKTFRLFKNCKWTRAGSNQTPAG